MIKESKLIEDENEIINGFRKLSPEMKEATIWLLENIDFVKRITRRKYRSEEKLNQLLDIAYDNNDYLAIALLIYMKARDFANR